MKVSEKGILRNACMENMFIFKSKQDLQFTLEDLIYLLSTILVVVIVGVFIWKVSL